ncbi:Glycosyl transferases group 1 [uncultured archaeon]|nr:Glycosyl transferases group 1 [uncultured archaeon]
MNIMFQVGSWHYDKGGTDLFVKTIAHWLAKKGHKVVVLVHRLEEEKCSDEDISFGKGAILVRYTPPQKKGLRFNPLVYSYRLFLTSLYLYRLAKKEEVQAIVVGETELLSVLPLKLLDVKIFCRGGALLYETMSKEVLKERGRGFYSKLFINLIRLYNKFTLKLPDVMVPVNEAEYSFMKVHMNNHALIKIIPHGIDINLFKPLKDRFLSRNVVVGYVGRLAPIKYPETALKIFKEASKGKRGVEFWWIGPLDPSYSANQFDLFKSQEGVSNAKYISKVDNSKLPNFLNKMDIFLQVEQQTNVSRSTTEAASCGLPIVALNKGKESYGFFTMNQTEAISRLHKLINSKDLRQKEGDRARQEIIKNFSEERIYQKYLDLFNLVTNKDERK